MYGIGLDTADLRQEVQNMANEFEEDARGTLEQLLEMIGVQTIAYLRSLTDEMRPPASGSSQMRPAHPGHWADVSGDLARGYDHRVESTALYVQLVLVNTAGHAIHLEARDGFFVLSGVTEEGGPVETALREAVGIVAPGWTVI